MEGVSCLATCLHDSAHGGTTIDSAGFHAESLYDCKGRGSYTGFKGINNLVGESSPATKVQIPHQVELLKNSDHTLV